MFVGRIYDLILEYIDVKLERKVTMAKSKNGNPKDPRNFLEELQRNSLEALEETQPESLGQIDPTQPRTAPLQTVEDPIITLTWFSHRVQLLVIDMDRELRETRLHSEELVEENKQMSLTIQSLNETIAERDASIKELKAKIETLTKEKVKLQTA